MQTTFPKTLPYVISPIVFAILFRTGAPSMTVLTAGALPDPQLHATASNVCTNLNPRYVGGLTESSSDVEDMLRRNIISTVN